MKTAVLRLIHSCGVSYQLSINKTEVLEDIMECFAVSTKRHKPHPPLPKPEDLGFLHYCRYVTPEVQAQAIMKSEGPIDTIVECNDHENTGGKMSADRKPKVDYYQVHMLCNAIEIVLEGKWSNLQHRTEKKVTQQTLIGHKLLKHRCRAFLDDTTEFVRGVKLMEEKLQCELQHLRWRHPTKHISQNNKTMTSNEFSSCNISRKRAAEGLLALASVKKSKRNKKSCAVVWCDCTNMTCSLKRVPVLPSPLKKTKSVKQQIN